MQLVALAALGGAIGSAARYLVGVSFAARFGTAFPWGTFAVNVIGSFLMGFLVEFVARRLGANDEMRVFLTTGVLGGFTTFSAFAYDFSVLNHRADLATGLVYVVASVVLAILALYAGLALARSLFP